MQKDRICTRESNDVGKKSILHTPLRKQIRGGRKGRAHRQGLDQLHNIAKKSDRRATRASSDAGPELAGREGHAAMESPQALIAPLKRGMGGLTLTRGASGFGPAPQYKKKRVLRRTSEDSPEERQLPTLPPGLAVPSAMTGLASLFGMGRGGSPSL